MKYLKRFENSNLEQHLLDSIKNGRLYKIKELIEKGVDKNFKDKYEKTLLMLSIFQANLQNSYNIDIIKYFISIDVDLDIQDNKGITALMYAASYSLRKFDVLCLIIEAGADWNIKDRDGSDFFEYVGFDVIKQKIISKYTDKYENYISKKEADKYNL